MGKKKNQERGEIVTYRGQHKTAQKGWIQRMNKCRKGTEQVEREEGETNVEMNM